MIGREKMIVGLVGSETMLSIVVGDTHPLQYDFCSVGQSCLSLFIMFILRRHYIED